MNEEPSSLPGSEQACPTTDSAADAPAKEQPASAGWLRSLWAGLRSRNILSAISLVVSVMVVLIAVLTLKYTVESGREMARLLSDLNESFDTTGRKLEALPESVARFDSSVNLMAEVATTQRDVLTEALDSLTSNLGGFSISLQNYRAQLEMIVAASDRQLELLAERQRLIEEELGRRADLRVIFGCHESDSGFWVITPVILNRGNAVSTFFTVFFEIPAGLGLEKGRLTESADVRSRHHLTIHEETPIAFASEADVHWSLSRPTWTFSLRSPPASGQLVIPYHIAFSHGSHVDSMLVRPERVSGR